MDEHSDILVQVLEWAWVGLVAVVAWLARKVIKVENDCTDDDAGSRTRIAVLGGAHESLRAEFDKEMQRNAVDHQTIIKRLDAHNERVMHRLDSLVSLAKNGSK